MKPFAKRLLALASAAAIALTTIPAVHGVNGDLIPVAPTAQWSESEVNAMNVMVPSMIRSASEAIPLTRQELCSMVINSYKAITGLTDAELEQPARVFTDTDDANILLACHLGLIEGKTAGIFAPNGTITRQDFWTVIVNLLELAGYPETDTSAVDLRSYRDSTDILPYAEHSAQVLLTLGAITADESAALEPAGSITIGEAEEVLSRIADLYVQWQESMNPRRYLGEEVAEFALNYVGCRYVRGGKGPNKFDCSGFVYYVYKNYGYSLKPGARNQWSLLNATNKQADLLPGDLVFFSNNGRSSGIFHVGIYIGNDQFVHAANSRKGLIVTDMDDDWYARRYLGAKRAIG